MANAVPLRSSRHICGLLRFSAVAEPHKCESGVANVDRQKRRPLLRKCHTIYATDRSDAVVDSADSDSSRSSRPLKGLLQRSWTIDHAGGGGAPVTPDAAAVNAALSTADVSRKVETWMDGCDTASPFSGSSSPLELQARTCLFCPLVFLYYVCFLLGVFFLLLPYYYIIICSIWLSQLGNSAFHSSGVGKSVLELSSYIQLFRKCCICYRILT